MTDSVGDAQRELAKWTRAIDAGENGLLQVNDDTKSISYISLNDKTKLEKSKIYLKHFFGISNTSLKSIHKFFKDNPKILKGQIDAQRCLATKIENYNKSKIRKFLGTSIECDSGTMVATRIFNEVLLGHKVDIDKYLNSDGFVDEIDGTSNKSILMMAAGTGDLESVKKLCENKATVNFERKVSRFLRGEGTALHEAIKSKSDLAQKNRSDIVRCLLEYGANPNILDYTDEKHPTSSLDLAIIQNDVEVVQILLASPKIQQDVKNSALLTAAKSNIPNRSNIIKLLLESGADPNIETEEQHKQYESPLTFAIRNNDFETIELLLAVPQIKERIVNKALGLAIDLNRSKAVERLLQRTPDSPNEFGIVQLSLTPEHRQMAQETFGITWNTEHPSTATLPNKWSIVRNRSDYIENITFFDESGRPRANLNAKREWHDSSENFSIYSEKQIQREFNRLQKTAESELEKRREETTILLEVLKNRQEMWSEECPYGLFSVNYVSIPYYNPPRYEIVEKTEKKWPATDFSRAKRWQKEH